MNLDQKQPELLALDTGGTMTDTFLIDGEGRYTVGKAQTTPADESRGVLSSFVDALGYWDLSMEDATSSMKGTVYSGTAMLNRLLEREGDSNIGIITTRGFEDTLRFGRGIQSWVDLSYAGRLHAREHEHPEPLVPRENIRGVRGRIHTTGQEVIPLYEQEAREAVKDLLDRQVRVICVCMPYSYLNPEHEQTIKRIADREKKQRGDQTPVWLSSDQNPVRGELPRLNSLVIEAYAVEPSRKQLLGVRDALRQEGIRAPFRVFTTSGGTIAPDHDWLVDSLISGPIGGVSGAEYLADQLGIDNLVCSDVGGTSFDVGLITEGHYPTRFDQSLAKFLINIPIRSMDTIGSGTGSYVRLDRTSSRIEIGPESAGYLVGVSNRESGLETPTVTDCAVVLGYLNPDYFLGGTVELDVEHARSVLQNRIADPLGTDVHRAARGVLDLVERNMANKLKSMILGLGYSPENYNLISYGGGGPLHVAGYTAPLAFKKVLIPEWAAAFSAFGCACADYSYRFDRTVDLEVQPGGSNLERVADALSEAVRGLRDRVAQAFDEDGIERERLDFRPALRIQYSGMLNDLEVDLQGLWKEDLNAEDLQEALNRYDDKFARIFQRAAQSPESGYTISTAVGTGVVPTPKPTIPEEPEQGTNPPDSAFKSERTIFWKDGWHDANIWEMSDLRAGNVLQGPAVLESPATTMLVPPEHEVRLDTNRIYHLRRR